MQTPLLSVAGVSRSLGRARVLDDVSLDVASGSVVGLIGPNGAGKTTLLRIIVGLANADSGIVAPGSPDSSHFGYLPEERGLYQRSRVGAVLTYLARLKGLSASDAASEIDRWLERVELGALRSRRVEQLSKGQQQKIQLVAAFIGDPPLLILDEPFSGLDPLNARLVVELVREASAAGRGVLVSAHQLALVEQFCTHIAMLVRGRIVVCGPIEEVRRGHAGTLDDLFLAQAGAEGGQR